MKSAFCCALLGVMPFFCHGAGWQIDGDRGIVCESPRGMGDSFEMSSRGVDAVVRWNVSKCGAWHRGGAMRFPTLRAGKDDTYGSWEIKFEDDVASEVKIDGCAMSPGAVLRVRIGAALVAEIDHGDDGMYETRVLFPALSATAFLESVVLSNASERAKTVDIAALSRSTMGDGVFGRLVSDSFVVGSGSFRLAPGSVLKYARCVAGMAENAPRYYPDAEAELSARMTLWRESADALFARVFTEGVFGIVPRGLHSFTVKPNLPRAWARAAFRNVRAHGAEFDLEVVRRNGKVCVRVAEGRPKRFIVEREIDEGCETFCKMYP